MDEDCSKILKHIEIQKKKVQSSINKYFNTLNLDNNLGVDNNFDELDDLDELNNFEINNLNESDNLNTWMRNSACTSHI
ncbi:hypothetical protein Glove_168g256 [Diversispora epigaea]|uniref:Uncharacterized protein n=1 Tax=Diversispora epigaea TaxID=1348612 RepID=A0A397IT01_9GLOM|nr:hypothetical protein Glove_168g256 [Diversispora epigaea]